jgi:hypothetical protein
LLDGYDATIAICRSYCGIESLNEILRVRLSQLLVPLALSLQYLPREQRNDAEHTNKKQEYEFSSEFHVASLVKDPRPT